jgi:hypothetical protein
MSEAANDGERTALEAIRRAGHRQLARFFLEEAEAWGPGGRLRCGDGRSGRRHKAAAWPLIASESHLARFRAGGGTYTLVYRRGRSRREILRNSGDSGKTGGTGKAGPTGARGRPRGRGAGCVLAENTHTGRLLTVENAVSSKRALIFLRFGLQFCVCSQNTHTGGRKGRRETPKTLKTPSGQAYRRVFTPVLCVCLCV